MSKIANAGFKLDYVVSEYCDNKLIGEIHLGDISSEIEYWQNAVVCYVLGAHTHHLQYLMDLSKEYGASMESTRWQ